MNLNNMQKVDLDKSYPCVTHEQLVVAEHLYMKGFDLYIEGPYICDYHKKQYCYVWAVGNLSGTIIKKIDGCGHNIN